MSRQEEADQIKPCACGFDGKKAINKHDGRQPAFDYCPSMNKLDNHVDCPSFDAIPHEEEPCEPYWRLIRGSIKQVRHWCFMGEIEEASYLTRPRLLIRTRFNENVLISFYLEKHLTPPTFSFDDALVGHTILIVDPEKSGFAKYDIRQEFGDLVVIFKCSMQTLIKTFESMIASPEACFQCQARPSGATHDASSANEETPSLKKCSRCKVALYCNTLCQTQNWNDSHKKLCASMKYLKLLRELDFGTTSVISRKKCPQFSFAV